MLTRDLKVLKITEKVLTIAGFDPSAGAGILADIKAFQQCGVAGQAVCTALTVQNENLFVKPGWIPWQQIKEQLDILYKEQNFNYIKIGLVENAKILEKILKYIRRKNPKAFIIWDPILKASAGFEFHKQNAATWRKLFTYIDLLTPNFPEYEFLCEGSEKLNVLLKGGHSSNPNFCEDILYYNGKTTVFKSKRIKGVSIHGSGCMLSALILANMAKYNNLEKAVGLAKRKMQKVFREVSKG